MAQQYLLDSNILVYVHDDRYPEKQRKSIEVIERVGQGPSAGLPVQVLAEFSNVTLNRLERPLLPHEVRQRIEMYEQVFPTFPLTQAMVLEAVRGVEEYSFSYYDGQIWAAAKFEQIPVVLSEDFPTGATIEGVTFINPLDEDFDLEEL